jgi:hypothetical protein
MSGYDRIEGAAPTPLSEPERLRRLAQLPNLGAIALLELDDRLTGRSWHNEVIVPLVGELGGWQQNGQVFFFEESLHAEFARRCAERGITVHRDYDKPEIQWECAA